MADDGDVIPVRDSKSRSGSGGSKKPRLAVNNENTDLDNHQRQMVSQWSREDVEDKYLRLYEENILLKKHGRKQEEKIKRMATKLLRLVSDKKKTDSDKSHKGRDIEAEEMMEDLQGKVRELERQNQVLKDKLMVSKQQLTHSNRPTPYQFVPSRVDTGRQKTPDPRLARNIRVAGPRPRSPNLPRYGHSLLEDAKVHNKQLEEIIAQQNEQMNIFEQEMENMREQTRIREAEFEEDLMKVKQQATAGQRATVQENVDMIRMQRELREKSSKLEQLQMKYEGMDKKLKAVKSSHDQLLREMEMQNEYLKQEQDRVLRLQNELKSGTSNQRRILELEEEVDSLKKEAEILKEANEKLIHSAFDLERERDWRTKEKALKVQIAQLEATLKADVGEKGGILDRLVEERDDKDKAEKDCSDMRIKYYESKQELDDLREKMKFFTEGNNMDFTEIEEALTIVKQKKLKEETQAFDFLEKVETEQNKDIGKQVIKLQAEYADTINELEKTRNMLIVQHNINKDYQTEVEAVTRKMEENRLEYETKLDEYARLLDIRAARIKKLEHQLKDVAYGTKQFRVRADEDMEVSDTEDLVDESISLERGQNLFEIHITKASLSKEGIEHIHDEEPVSFCTWEFFEFELQSTGLLKGAHPKYDFTSQYVVEVDDFFLHYLQKETASLELHQALGTDYRTVAACQLAFREIFDKPHGRIHGTAQLLGVNDCAGVNFGSVDYWIRLRVPIDQALRLYKERTKALGYLGANARVGDQMETIDQASRERASDNVNQLHVKVIRCTGVESRREGLQPSSYAVYKFFDFPDHDTSIVPNSNQPEFEDSQVYPVTMTSDVDRYLKAQPLLIYIFDDTEADDTAYLGVATVPLIPLAHDKVVKGTFELKQADGTQNGTIDVQLAWQYTYIPPRGSTKTAAQILASGASMPTPSGPSVALMPGEQLDKHNISLPIQPKKPTVQPSAPQKSVARRKSPPVEQPKLPSQPPTPVRSQPPTPMRSQPTTPMRSQPPTPPRSHPRTPPRSRPGSQKASPRDELIMPVVTAPAASSPRRGSVASGDSVEEEMQAVLRPVPTKRVQPQVTGSREEGLRALEQSLSMKYDSSEHSEYEGAEEDQLEPENAPPRHATVENIDQQLQALQEKPKEGEGSKKDENDKKKGKKDDKKRRKDDKKRKDRKVAKEQEDDDDTAVDESLEEDIVSPKSGNGGESSVTESDSEGLVMKGGSQRVTGTFKSDTVTVTIFWLTLDEGAPAMKDDNIQLLFVEYRFLNYPPDELETPYPLPKPSTPGEPVIFNFSKVFHVDMDANYEHRQYLASMLLPEDSDEGRIRFTVVSEPTDDNQSAECEDVGVAFVSVRDILKNEADLVEQTVPVYDVRDESTVIGGLKVTVECLQAIKAVREEMDSDVSLDQALTDM